MMFCYIDRGKSYMHTLSSYLEVFIEDTAIYLTNTAEWLHFVYA